MSLILPLARSTEGRLHFGQVIGLLMQAGVESYVADYRARRTTYYLPDGDTFIVFPALRVLHTGDAFPNKGMPIMDINNGGSGVAIGETLSKAASGIKGVDSVITGHSTVMTWADLEEYAYGNKSPDPGAYMRGWTCAEAAQQKNEWSGSNWARYCNPAYDALYQQSTT